jgi:DNA (cytosine-5)-methyltransferase 1
MVMMGREARHRRLELRVADLFCGAGGLSEGFRAAGFRILAGNDVDPDACATYALNFPEARTVSGDVRTPEVQEQVLSLARAANILVGGPPCQAFSQVRNHARLIDDPRNSLYREFVRVVGEVAPLAFVMENVPGLEQMGAKEQVRQDLALDGEYQVAAQLVDAADFGVPQTRKRLVFIGLHRSLGGSPPVLHGTGATAALDLERRNGSAPPYYQILRRDRSASTLLARLLDPGDPALVTAEQAIGDLRWLRAGDRAEERSTAELPPAESAYQEALRKDSGSVLRNVSVPRMNADTVLRLGAIPPGGNHRDLDEELLERYLTGQRWGPSNGTGRLGRRHYYAYRRLHPDIWSWTLNTKADSVYHYQDSRALSVREFARLQSFPDRFVFTTDPRRGELPGRIEGGAAHSRYRQAGNAVPPLLARSIAEALAASLLAGASEGSVATGAAGLTLFPM